MVRTLIAGLFLAAASLPFFASPTKADMRCYITNGKQVCCLITGQIVSCQ